VATKAGAFVDAGDELGAVGHSGLNASRPKHGRHLHFEINQIEDGRVRALRATELWAVLRGQAPAATGGAGK
jgi:murein DD-endopeptidase MepM/ murein hydrolase activator NlpD